MQNATTPLNPNVYLNYLDPETATQFENARNFYLAILGAAIWDTLAYIPTDIRIVSKGFNVVIFCFIFSRVFAIAYALLFVVIQTHSMTHCQALPVTLQICCVLSMACTSFLFLRRLLAVYAEGRIIRWISILLWIGMNACEIPTFTLARMEHIPGTNYCAYYSIKSYMAIIDFFPAAFDTVVFLAISFKAISIHRVPDEGVNWRTVITGKALPRLSQALLQGGQQYYLIVFGITIISGAVLYTPSIPLIYRPIMVLAATTLTASMACRVFRNMRTLESDDQSFYFPTAELILARPTNHTGRWGR